MSRRTHRSTKARSCTGKEQMTQAEAIGKALRLQRLGSYRMETYKCRHCKKWHVGHPSKAKR
jgi:hypothetical protein